MIPFKIVSMQHPTIRRTVDLSLPAEEMSPAASCDHPFVERNSLIGGYRLRRILQFSIHVPEKLLNFSQGIFSFDCSNRFPHTDSLIECELNLIELDRIFCELLRSDPANLQASRSGT